MPWPAIATTRPTAIGRRPARIATGMRTAPISGTAGVGQKNSEMKYVTTTSVQKARWPLRITPRNGATIFRSAPMACNECSIAVTSAMIRKMLNRFVAATRLALNTAESPRMTLCEKTSAVARVATTAGTTMFFRAIIVAMMTTTPAR